MAITPIDVVIDPPLPTDAPSIFDQKAFAAWAAINGWAEQANALAVQVNTAADRVNDPSVQAVADNIADVMAVAGIEASVTIVATNSANVAAVAGNETNINAVNANKPNIDAVAGNKTNIDTVAGIAADVAAVASIDDDVSAVAGAAADVSTVATNISDVQAAAADMAAIKAAPGAADAAASSANTAGLAATAAEDAAGDAIEARGQAVAAASAAGDSAGAASQSASDAFDILQQVIAHGNGWTPTIANVVDGERVVMQLLDWTGGQGTKPATGYIGPAGVVPTIGEATDIRGAPGSGAVSSVNSVEPDGNGNVDLGIADIPGLEDALDNAGQVKTVAGKGPDGSGNVALVKGDVGLGNVDNVSAADLRDRSTHTGTQSASTITGLAAVATSGSYNDLSNRPSIPAAQVNSDWTAASGIAQILNKPATIGQEEAEAGTATTVRMFTSQRVRQNVVAYVQPILGDIQNALDTINGV